MASSLQTTDVPDVSLMRSTAREIGLALIERDEVGRNSALTLTGGLAGLTTLYASLVAIDDDAESFRREARRCLREFQHRLPELTFTHCGLYNGLAGMAWSICYAADRIGESEFLAQDLTDVLEVMDSFLSREDDLDFDLISGVAGTGMFTLTLRETEWRERLTKRILDRLARSAAMFGDGIAWATPASRHAKRFDSTNSREFNLGLAHGAPGVINFLAHCVLLGVCEDQSRQLLEQSTSWLCRQTLP